MSQTVPTEPPAQPMVIRPSLRAALERFFIALGAVLGLLVPAMVATFLFGPQDAGVAGALGLLDTTFTFGIPIAVSLFPAIQLAFTRYVLDEDGIREHVQIFTKTEKRVAWEKVTALQHHRTALDRILGIERLEVIAYGERGTTVKMVGLTQAPALRDLVAKQMRKQASVARLFSND